MCEVYPQGRKEINSVISLIHYFQISVLLKTRLTHEYLQPVGPVKTGPWKTVHAVVMGVKLAIKNGLHSLDFESSLCTQ